MSKGLEELKRMAYETACCRCQYYIDKKCTNEGECVWKSLSKDLEILEIIKKKRVNIGNFKEMFEEYPNMTFELYDYGNYGNDFECGDKLAETEFNLIKEWLNNGD